MHSERLFRPERRTRGDTNVFPLQPIDAASWIWRAGEDRWGAAAFADTRTSPEALAAAPQTFLRFRCGFEVPPDAPPLELDVSADERYVLLLDGEELSRGPHRGYPHRWHYASLRVSDLAPGRHRLEAVCWQIGPHAPLAQLSVRGGFVLKASGPYDAALTTGAAPWRVAPLSGTRMTDKGNSATFGVGSECEVRGASILDEEPPEDAWEDAAVVRGPVTEQAKFYGLRVPGWMLFPTPLPEMMRERKAPGRFVGGSGAEPPIVGTIPARTSRTLLWDLGDYFCAYPELRVSGGRGARVRWDWAECLVGPDGRKRDRAAWEGLAMDKCFGDTFLPDGRDGARFTTPWWRCGRWCRLRVETADEPLRVDSLALLETRLPASLEASFDLPAHPNLLSVCARSLQMCMHEMFFDCPFYEQQMYPGDSRVQYLVATLFGETGRTAVRNAIALYDADRRENGLMPMNAPTRGTQESLPFTCCQAMMLGDLAWNHDDPATVRARLPGLVHTLLGMEVHLGPDGLLGRTPGWNFIDWVPEWRNGVPPDGNADRPNAEINLEFLHAVLSAVRAAEALGEGTLAAFWRERAERLRAAIRTAFWCPDRALLSSDVAHTAFSQHAQALALLADVLPPADAARCFDALARDERRRAAASAGGEAEAAEPPLPPLARGSIYFRHYLFATFFAFHRPDLFFDGLGFWRESIGAWHCATVPEIPDPDSRSDCHGWGSHPLWHLQTGVAGVRSDAPFYRRVLVEPQPGPLPAIRSSTPTPHGPVALDLRFDGERAAGTVTLPPGLSGTFRWRGRDLPLRPGVNDIAPSAETC